MELRREFFGNTATGEKVERFILGNSGGLEVSVISYGCILTSVRQPDRRGRSAEVTLGFETLDRYLAGHPYLGALVGRFANRIAAGRFKLDGVRYELDRNEKGVHHLHGGSAGFDKKVWRAEELRGERQVGVRFSRTSPDGEEGYPGTVQVSAAYTLNEDNELAFEYQAQTDRPTPINLTNHAYWNLAGAGSGTIYGHELTLHCSRYLPVDDSLIPTGEIRSVRGGALDFTEGKPIGRDIGLMGLGYDHCFVADKEPGSLAVVARLYEPSSGRGLEIASSKPAIQLYTGNFLSALRGAAGALFDRHTALCLETEYFPDAVNQPDFPCAILRPGELYRHTTVQRFFSE